MEYIYFVSNNQNKYEEMKKLFDLSKIELAQYKMKIEELQTEDMNKLIKNKALVAYKELRRPVLVEHTTFCIKAFGDLPGHQAEYFYAHFGADNIVDFCKYKNEFAAYTESIICFCDGKKYKIGRGREDGFIATKKSEKKEVFAWDKIFIPVDNNEQGFTYDELGEEKKKRSMRRRAWEELKNQVGEEAFTCVDEEDKLDELAKLLIEKKVMLFIGAGISASLGLPTWNGLMRELGKKEGFEEELFQCHGDNMLLAEYVGRNGNVAVYDMMKEQLSIDGNKDIEEKLENSQIYKAILGLGCPVIYTTNQDLILETYFGMKGHNYNKIAKISDINQEEKTATRIVKFHGDIEDEESIVLTESQYFERMDFKSFLDIQLQADMLRYHVLFLGYSLSDINVKLLMYLMRKQWGNDKAKKAYIFTATPNQVQQAVFEKNSIVAISGSCADKEKGTLEFLERLQEKMK